MRLRKKRAERIRHYTATGDRFRFRMHRRSADRAWSDVEWFVRHGRLWRRYHERVEEVCWDADEIRLTFQEAGFDQVRAWDAARFFEDNPLIASGCRTVYLACKARS